MNIFKKFLEVIFPSHCVSCDKTVSKDGIFCYKCWSQLRFITDPKCAICSHPFELTIDGMQPLCAKCLQKKPPYDKSIIALRYDKLIGNVISQFKYHDQTFLAKKLALLLWKRFSAEIVKYDMIVAVPLHHQKLRQRKYNQTILLAKQLAKRGSVEFFPDFLLKVKDTKPQASLRQKQRQNNLKRNFLVAHKFRDKIAGKKILLIDDVITTGATIESCTKELKRRKVAEVAVMAVAKTVIE